MILGIIQSHKSTLVFTNTREHAEALASQIQAIGAGIPVRVHHGSLSRELREEAEQEFQAGKLKALICTSSLELGIDIGSVDFIIRGFDSKIFSIPSPADSVKNWPLIGEQVYRLWTQAATDIKTILLEVLPRLKPLGGKLLEISGTVVFGLLEFVAAIIISGFLYSPGPRLADSLGAVLRRIFGPRSEEMLKLAGSTIRNVSRGVVGIALVQSFLAGLGFLAAGIPAAGFLSFIALVLAIIQIGPAILFIPIIVWSWTAMETSNALMFTAYMVPVGLVDNVLRPIVMARGLTTPMPVIFIGVVGGTLAYGISGLFLGPIVLSVTWALLVAWVQEDSPGGRGAASG